MLCAKCHKNEATIQFTPVVDGKPRKIIHLCKDCVPDPQAKILEAFYWRVTPEEFARLQCDAKAAESFFWPSLEELLEEMIRHVEALGDLEKLPGRRQEQEGGDRILVIGPFWHALHFLLTGDSELKPHPLPPPPLGNVVQGGTPTQWPCKHGHVRSLMPDEVRAVADALSKISVEELRSRFSIASFNAVHIYPRPGRACWTDEDAEPIFEIYPRVVEFYRSAARDGDMILFSLD
jgi:hypothetical protein